MECVQSNKKWVEIIFFINFNLIFFKIIIKITINLGKGSGLEIFNQRIKQINVKRGDIHHGKNK